MWMAPRVVTVWLPTLIFIIHWTGVAERIDPNHRSTVLFGKSPDVATVPECEFRLKITKRELRLSPAV